MADYLFCARRHLLDWITPSAVPGGGSVWRGRLGNKGEALLRAALPGKMSVWASC